MQRPNIAPFFACLYPSLCTKARELGYALAIHGSMVTDMDLVAIPWTEEAVTPAKLKSALMSHVSACDYEGYLRGQITDESVILEALKSVGNADGPTSKPHGRIAWNLWFAFGRKIDLSIMPPHHTLPRIPVPGWICGKCDDCGTTWKETSRDILSPSRIDCPNKCDNGGDTHIWNEYYDEDLRQDASGNILNPQTEILTRGLGYKH